MNGSHIFKKLYRVQLSSFEKVLHLCRVGTVMSYHHTFIPTSLEKPLPHWHSPFATTMDWCSRIRTERYSGGGVYLGLVLLVDIYVCGRVHCARCVGALGIYVGGFIVLDLCVWRVIAFSVGHCTKCVVVIVLAMCVWEGSLC